MLDIIQKINPFKKKKPSRFSVLRKKSNLLFVFFFTFSIGTIFLVFIYVFPKIWSLDFQVTKVIEVLAKPANLGPALPDGPIDMLLVGTGGDENDAPYLTDTLIYLHYSTEQETASMLSIPRDLFVNSSYLGVVKINSVYSRLRNRLGHEKAMEHLLEIVSKITGKSVKYYVQGDFQGFRKVVDHLGGIEVDVPDRIYDPNFPDDNWGYRALLIEEGLQEFDGNTALAYARTRKTTSDFDRSKRQQLILGAIRDKLYQAEILLSPKKIEQLFILFQDNISTNFSLAQTLQLAALAHEFDTEAMYSFGLNDTCQLSIELCEMGGFLYTPSREYFDNQSGFLPNGATAYNISYYNDTRKFTHLITSYPKFSLQSREMHVFNSTGTPGIASTYALYLKSFGFNIPSAQVVGNANIEDNIASFAYYSPELSSDDDTIQAISFFLGDSSVKPKILPEFATIGESAIEVVLGKNYSTIFD